MNNRIALEDSLTKQYVTIGPEAVAGIQDPDEAAERLNHVMDEVGSLLDSLRGDHAYLPHYVDPNFVDPKNTVPDNASFLDAVNGDISAVLHVPRVSMGQERGPPSLRSTQTNGACRLSADFSKSRSSLAPSVQSAP